MNKRSWKKNWINEYVILICIVAIIEFFYLINIMGEVPLHTTSDELGALVGPAYLAGRNWSGVISHSGYYGFGFFSLFFWVFDITDNPIIIYRFLLFFCSLQRSLVPFIVYYISNHFLMISSKKLVFVICSLMPFLHSGRIVSTSNEYSLEIIIWLNILVLLKIVEYRENKKKLYAYGLLLLFLLSYMQTIHTRTLVLVIANCIILILYALWTKCFFFLICEGVGIGFFTFFVRKLIKYYQVFVWGNGGGETLRNANASINTSFDILDKTTWSVWGHMLIGMLNTENLVLCGLFLFACITIVFYFINIIKTEIKNENEHIYYVDIIILLCVLCIGATILAFLVSSWSEGMMLGWDSGGKKHMYYFKGLTYVRYWEPYVAPLIFVAIYLYVQKMTNRNKILMTTISLFLVMKIVFIKNVVPYIAYNKDALSPFYGVSMYHNEQIVSADNYYVAILVVTTVFLLSMYFFYTRRYCYALLISLVMLVISYRHAIVEYDYDIQSQTSSLVNSSYAKLNELEQMGIVPDKIYIFDSRENIDNNWKLYSIAQFYLNEFMLVEKRVESLKKNEILISAEMIEDMKDVIAVRLDTNEIWYISSEDNKLKEVLESE